MVNKTIETKKVTNRFNDYLQCNYCNDEIEINDDYFILWNNKKYCEYVICNNICVSNATEFIVNK
jgi:hypothetical protein